jgi:hypothetical protein
MPRGRSIDQISLLTHHAHHCRAAVDHVEHMGCRAAHVDNSTTTIRPAIRDVDDYRFAIASVGHEHLRAKWQCPMSSSKPGRTGYFPACSLPTRHRMRQDRFQRELDRSLSMIRPQPTRVLRRSPSLNVGRSTKFPEPRTASSARAATILAAVRAVDFRSNLGSDLRVTRRCQSIQSSGLSSAVEGCSSNEQMSPPPKSSSGGGCARRFGGGTCLFAGVSLPLAIKALLKKCQPYLDRSLQPTTVRSQRADHNPVSSQANALSFSSKSKCSILACTK